jgi:hypothetical protein
MSKRFLAVTALVIVMILALGLLALPALAAPPVCPNGFMAMPADHEGDHEHDDSHLHVGIWPDTDKNGDGTICVKHVTQGSQEVHVHIDNIAP